MPKANWRLGVLLLISAILYVVMGYFMPRENTTQLLITYFALFTLYLAAFLSGDQQHIKLLIFAGIGFRLLFLFSTPWLSDDIYRFIWDGRLLMNGISPFAELPSTVIQSSTIPGINNELFSLLNSPDYFTVYPPLSQLVFWMATVVSPNNILGSIVTIRVLIVLAEVGSIYIIGKLLERYKLPAKNTLLYVLNPLVILELTGNLHFEAFVVFFILCAIYLLSKNKLVTAGMSWGTATGFKLIPLIFLPLLLRKLSLRKLVIVYVTVGLTSILLFIPLLDQHLINGLSSSLGLYFQKFEFNASIYYLVREVGFWITGYNEIGIIGPGLAIVTFLSIMIYSLFFQSPLRVTLSGTKNNKHSSESSERDSESFKSLVAGMMWVLLIYLSLTTTVHPWYICTLVALSVFTRYRFAIWWSGLIFLTYVGYSTTGYEQPFALIVVEYVILAGVIIYELYYGRIMLKHE